MQRTSGQVRGMRKGAGTSSLVTGVNFHKAGKDAPVPSPGATPIDFHHGVTYVVARLGGFGHREASVRRLTTEDGGPEGLTTGILINCRGMRDAGAFVTLFWTGLTGFLGFF